MKEQEVEWGVMRAALKGYSRGQVLTYTDVFLVTPAVGCTVGFSLAIKLKIRVAMNLTNNVISLNTILYCSSRHYYLSMDF